MFSWLFGGRRGEAKAYNLERSLDGGSCLNQRSLRAGIALFRETDAREAQPIRLQELLDGLWFLEQLIISSNISYDGTLPPGDLGELSEATASFCASSGFSERFFGPVAPKSAQEQLTFVTSGAVRALDDVGALTADGRAFGPHDAIDKPLSTEAASVFFAKLAEIAARPDAPRDRLAVSQDEFDAMLGGGFRGSKCVAGFASLGRDAVARALEVPDRFSTSPERGAAMLINRFRFMYVRQLSYGARDVYVPAANWRRLSEHHAVTFSELVQRAFQERHAGRLTRDITASLSAELGGQDRTYTLALPPIGLYALMTSDEAAGPAGVARTAREAFIDYGRAFRNFRAKTREVKPPPGGWTAETGDPHLDAAAERIERTLSDKLGKLDAATANLRAGKAVSTLDDVLAPVMDLTIEIASGAIGDLVAELTTNVAGLLAGALAEEALQRLYGVARDRAIAHIDEYRALDDAMLTSFGPQLNLAALAEKVENTLGRRLVAD